MLTRRCMTCVVFAGVVLGAILFGCDGVLAQEAMADLERDGKAVGRLSPSSNQPVVGREITVSALDNVQYWPAVAYNERHGEYLVVWQNSWSGSRDIYGQRVTIEGELKSWFSISTGAYDRVQPSVAYDSINDRYLVTWAYDVNGNGSNWDVRGRLIPWNGPSASLAEFTICDWTTTQWNPKVAYARAQAEFLVVWWTESSAPGYVGGRRIDAATGTALDKAFAIAHNASDNRVGPDIAYNLNRNEYLITYHNGSDVYGMRLQGDGTILGGGEFGIAGWPDTEINPAVASCRQTDQYLVAWQSLQGAGQYNIYARFVSGGGTPENVHRVYGYPVHQKAPDVACTGSLYFVTWEHQYSNITGLYGIWGRMISTDESMMDPITLMSPTAGVQAEFSRPAGAGGPAQFLTVWEHDRAGSAYQDVHGRIAIPYALYAPLVVRP